jgi:branched-subunit amino acid aminotransferase/4-amino-4-deoxychorismate lyase
MIIPADDRGFTLGDGLFETLLWEDGGLVFWPEHFARLERGCRTLGLPAPNERAALEVVLPAGQVLGETRGAVRLTLTAGSGGRGLDRPASPEVRLVATAAPVPLVTGPTTLATATILRNGGSPASRLKTLSYLDNILARREAVAAGADEALMLNADGEVACAAAANLFWLKDGVLHTPALECGVLDGVIRRRLLAGSPLPTREVRAGLDAVRTADAVYLTNSLIGIRPVGRLDGQDLPMQPEFHQQSAQVIAADRRGRK